MISLLCRWSVLAVVLAAIPASAVAAEQVRAPMDARRSLQIPPQDILNIGTDSRVSTPETPASLEAPATRPALPVGRADQVPAVPERAESVSGSIALPPEALGGESRPLGRSSDPERRILTVRASELKDINRSGRSGSPWSAADLWPLLSVLALILLLAWIVKRSMRGRHILAGSGAIEVLSRTPLSSKQSLVLVKMGRRLLLLGVTGDEMNTLCVVEDPEQVATLVGEAASGQPGSMTQAFARAFDEESGAYGPHAIEEDEETRDTGEPVRSLLDKVRSLTSRRNVA